MLLTILESNSSFNGNAAAHQLFTHKNMLTSSFALLGFGGNQLAYQVHLLLTKMATWG
jgi:hypothetical protein